MAITITLVYGSIIENITAETLQELVTAYFNIDQANMVLKHNSVNLDLSRAFEDYGITDGDLILVSEANKDHTTNNNNTNSNRSNSAVANAVADAIANTIPGFSGTTTASQNHPNQSNPGGDIWDDGLEDSYFTHSPIYIGVQYGDYKFRAMLDSGAQPNVISHEMARFLGIDGMIDTRAQGYAKGVGTCKIDGVIQGCMMNIGNQQQVPLNFKVAQIEVDTHLVLLGLDFLVNNHCVMDFSKRTLVMGRYNNLEIRFLNELELTEYKYPINYKQQQIKLNYNSLNRQLGYEKQQAMKKLLSTIIDNIINHPTMDKYRHIHTTSRTFKETFADDRALEFIKQIGFYASPDGKLLSFNDTLENLNYTKMLLASA